MSAATQLWPFKPLDKMTEVLEWSTDVIRSQAAEQRLALRPAPRRSFDLDHMLDAQQYSAAQELVRRYQSFLVPDWTQVVRVSTYPGSEVTIAFAPGCLTIPDDGQAVLWRDAAHYEVIDLIPTSSPELGVTASVASAWFDARLMPVYPAIAPDGLSPQRLTHWAAKASIRMDLSGPGASDPASTYPQYRGLDVMTDCPRLGGGLAEPLSWPVDRVDNETGLFSALRTRAAPDASYTVSWRAGDACALKALRAWLDSRAGRLKAFWIASRGRDFLPLGDLHAADTTLTVAGLPGVLPLARDTFDIEISSAAGAALRRQVTGFAVIAGPSLVLTLDAAVGADIAKADIQRISNLRCVRFNADRIELVHRAVSGTEVQVTVIEVPVPV